MAKGNIIKYWDNGVLKPVNGSSGNGGSYVLPAASETALGGIKAAPAQAGDTKGVYIGDDQMLHVAPDVLVVQGTNEGGGWKADVGSETIRSFGGEVILKAEVDGIPYTYRYQRYESARGAVFTNPDIKAAAIKQIEIIVDRDGNITRNDIPFEGGTGPSTAAELAAVVPEGLTAEANVQAVLDALAKEKGASGAFIAKYGVTTKAELDAAKNAQKILYCYNYPFGYVAPATVVGDFYVFTGIGVEYKATGDTEHPDHFKVTQFHMTVGGKWLPKVQFDVPVNTAGLGMTGATAGQIAQIEEVDENGVPIRWKSVPKPTDGTGLSDEQKSLIVTIMRAGTYTSDQSNNINRLEELFNGGTPVQTWTITNNLTNCKTSNQSATITQDSQYAATLTADEGYTLDGATVTVLMGGADVTSSVYSSGAVLVPKATGNIVITAEAKKQAAGGVVDLTGKFTMDGYYYDNVGTITNQKSSSKSYSKGLKPFIKLIPGKKYKYTTYVPTPYEETWTRMGLLIQNSEFPSVPGSTEIRTDKGTWGGTSTFEGNAKIVDGVKHAKVTLNWVATEDNQYFHSYRGAKIADSDCSLTYEEA